MHFKKYSLFEPKQFVFIRLKRNEMIRLYWFITLFYYLTILSILYMRVFIIVGNPQPVSQTLTASKINGIKKS